MCFLPRPRYSLPTARQNIAFGGLNQLPKIQIGELRASTNMDNSMLPALRVRGGRYIEQELELQPGDSLFLAKYFCYKRNICKNIHKIRYGHIAAGYY